MRRIFVVLLLFAVPQLFAATRTWTGAADTNWTTPGNWSGGVAPVAGDDLVFPASGANQSTTNNDFPAGTMFNSISFTGGSYFPQGNAIALGAGGIQSLNNFDSISLPITLAATQTWNSGGSIFVTGDVNLNGMALTLSGSFVLFDGLISGAGSITGLADNVNIDGTSTTSAPFTIKNEFLNVAGTYTGPIIIDANGSLGIDPGGTVGKVTSNGGTPGTFTRFSPGSGATKGAANTGDIDLHVGGEINIEIAGATNFGSANVTGTVNITNAFLDLNVSALIPAGTTFTIIDNDGTDPIIGTFNGLPEGSETLSFGTPRQIFKVSYVGGTGNDVVITAEGPAIGTTMTLTASPNPGLVNQVITFTATVAPKSGTATPAGTVLFFDESATPDVLLGTATLDTSGKATFTTSALALGSHDIIASYPGTAPFSGSFARLDEQIVPTPIPTLDPRVLVLLALALGAAGFLLANHD